MHLTTIFCTIFATTLSLVNASQTAYDIASALEQLAFQSYAIRPIVETFTQTNAALTLIGQGPIVETNLLVDEMVTTIISNIAAMEFTANYTDQDSEFEIAQSYSDFVQGTLELCDAYTAAAATVGSTDALTATKVSSTLKRLGNIIDAYFFNVIVIAPTDPDAVTQKNRVDMHFVQASTAWAIIQNPTYDVPNVPQVDLNSTSTLNGTSTTATSSTTGAAASGSSVSGAGTSGTGTSQSSTDTTASGSGTSTSGSGTSTSGSGTSGTGSGTSTSGSGSSSSGDGTTTSSDGTSTSDDISSGSGSTGSGDSTTGSGSSTGGSTTSSTDGSSTSSGSKWLKRTALKFKA